MRSNAHSTPPPPNPKPRAPQVSLDAAKGISLVVSWFLALAAFVAVWCLSLPWFNPTHKPRRSQRDAAQRQARRAQGASPPTDDLGASGSAASASASDDLGRSSDEGPSDQQAPADLAPSGIEVAEVAEKGKGAAGLDHTLCYIGGRGAGGAGSEWEADSAHGYLPSASQVVSAAAAAAPAAAEAGGSAAVPSAARGVAESVDTSTGAPVGAAEVGGGGGEDVVAHVALEYSIPHLGYDSNFIYGGLGAVSILVRLRACL